MMVWPDPENMKKHAINFANEVLTKTEWALAEAKLFQFRRHPDWRKALDKVKHRFEVDSAVVPGGKGILDRDLVSMFEAADQEFIDEIIRNGG